MRLISKSVKQMSLVERYSTTGTNSVKKKKHRKMYYYHHMKHFIEKHRNATVSSTVSGKSLATNLKWRRLKMFFLNCSTKKFTERETQKCKNSK